MNHYIDLTIKASAVIATHAHPHQIMSVVYSRLHIALAKSDCTGIAVSFPDVSEQTKTLGLRMRLHGTQMGLFKFLPVGWLGTVADCVELGQCLAVPNGVSYCTVRRARVRTGAELMRRRLMRRHGISAEEALVRMPNSIVRTLDLPYIYVRSQSTGQAFPIFIEHGVLQENAVAGEFNAYGLGQGATVPWF